MTPFCFKQTIDADIDPTFKFTTTLVDYVGLRLREDLSYFLGEWFLDTRQGMPYWRFILGQKYDAGIADRIFRKGALATAGVATVDQLITKFDRRSRTLSVPVFKVTLVDGSTLTQDQLGNPFILDLGGNFVPA